MKYTSKDGRVHYSTLKQIARSPAHFRHAAMFPKAPTPAMLLGSAVDAMVFNTGNVIKYDGVRNGKKWEEFQVSNPGCHILNPREYDAVWGAASAVKDSDFSALFRGEHQRVIRWDLDGVPFAAGIEGERGGLDVLGEDYVLDLKATTDTEPGRSSP